MAEAVLPLFGLVGAGVSGILNKPKIPQLPKPPTIDDATKNRAEQDRLARRRGVLSNIYAGGTSQSAPSVGQATLLGQ
jgi:hypothetical protein